MSHSVTFTRTITSRTDASYILLNTGYFKTVPGMLKILQLLIGGGMVGIFTYYQTNGSCWVGINGVIFAFLMSVSFLIGTFCLCLSYLVCLSTGAIISKTNYELVYHTVAAIMILVCSILLLISVADRYRRHDAYMAASIMGLVNAVLYFISAFFARRTYFV